MQLATALALTVLGTSAFAQSGPHPRPLPGPVRDAGVYHVATGTWTRAGDAQTTLSPDAIYRNDVPIGYFGAGWEGCWGVDEIVLPGLDHPRGGAQNAYVIDGFDFVYCKSGAGSIDWVFGFYDSYVPCDDPSAPANCIAEKPPFLVAGLPGGSACWLITLDLTGGAEICLAADGGSCAPGYQGGAQGLDHAGIGLGWFTSDGGLAGPALAGEPTWFPPGEGTCYDPDFSNPCALAIATGLGAQDFFSLSSHDPGAFGFANCAFGSGCYFFGGQPMNVCGPAWGPIMQFQFRLFADCTATCSPGGGAAGVYCDESQNPNNHGDVWIETLDSSATAIPLWLEAASSAGQFAALLVGDGNAVISQPPGSVGDLCVVGGSCFGTYDLDVVQLDAQGRGVVPLKKTSSSPCGGGVTFAPGASWNFQWWHRQPQGQPSTFSAALAVTFR